MSGDPFYPDPGLIASLDADDKGPLRFAAHDLVFGAWLDHEIVEWETADALPVDPTVADGDGAYRTAGRTPDRVVLAHRPGPSALETLLQWIASRPGMEWSNHPREVVVTKEHVYATHRDGSVAPLPLQRLRVARSSSSGDRLFVFGRNTRLLLPRRDDCTVVSALDPLLAREGPDDA